MADQIKPIVIPILGATNLDEVVADVNAQLAKIVPVAQTVDRKLASAMQASTKHAETLGQVGAKMAKGFGVASFAVGVFAAGVFKLGTAAADSIKRLDELGMLTKDQRAASEKAGAAIAGMTASMDMLVATVVTDLAPAIENGAVMFAALGLAAKDAYKEISEGVETAGKAAKEPDSWFSKLTKDAVGFADKVSGGYQAVTYAVEDLGVSMGVLDAKGVAVTRAMTESADGTFKFSDAVAAVIEPGGDGSITTYMEKARELVVTVDDLTRATEGAATKQMSLEEQTKRVNDAIRERIGLQDKMVGRAIEGIEAQQSKVQALSAAIATDVAENSKRQVEAAQAAATGDYEAWKTSEEAKQSLRQSMISATVDGALQLAVAIGDIAASSFKNEKKGAIFAALLNTAVSVTKSLATLGVPAGIPAAATAAALGAAQLVAIRAQNPPKISVPAVPGGVKFHNGLDATPIESRGAAASGLGAGERMVNAQIGEAIVTGRQLREAVSGGGGATYLMMDSRLYELQAARSKKLGVLRDTSQSTGQRRFRGR